MLDGDGVPDIGVVSQTGRFSKLSVSEDIARVRRGVLSAAAGSMVLVDLDDDGLDDPVFAGEGNIVSLLASPDTEPQKYTAGPSFSLSSSFSEAPTRLLGSGDFDLDGDTDLLVLRPSDEVFGWIETMEGPSFGNFHPIALAGRTFISAGGFSGGGPQQSGYHWNDRPQTLVTDIDEDGDPDIITAPSALGNRPALHRNTSVGFSIEPFGDPLPAFPVGGLSPSLLPVPRIFVGNFHGNGPGIALLVTTTNYYGSMSFQLRHLGNDGSLIGTAELPFAELATPLDFDLDGITDFITAKGPGFDVFGNSVGGTDLLFHRGTGDGGFEAPVRVAVPRGLISEILAGDFNGDGLPDVVAVSVETGIVEIFEQQLLDPLPGFAEWAAGYSLSDLSGNGDEDRDGVRDIIEYLSGTDPGLRGSSPTGPAEPPVVPAIEMYRWSDGTARIARPRLLEGSPLRISFEASSDLDKWIDQGAPMITVDPAHPLWEKLSWSVPQTDGGSGFFRIRIEPPEPQAGF